MKYSYENEKTLRISLTFKDLREHEMRLVDFLTEQDKVEALFFELVDELDLDERWDDPEVMTFQIRPHRDGIDLLVSDDFEGMQDLSPAEMTSELEQFMKTVSGDKNFQFPEVEDPKEQEKIESAREAHKEKEVPTPDFIYYTLKFDDFSDVLKLAKTVSANIDESELYEYQGGYYLTALDNQKVKGKKAAMALRAIMLEYGEQAPFSREQLREHATIVLGSKAIETLQKI